MLKRRGILLSLVGPAGSGKTSHGEELLKEFSSSLAYSVSATTRAPRSGEKEGVHYYFLSKEDFARRVAAAEFFEWEEVHGNSYGTLKATVDKAINDGRDLLLDIDIKGAMTFKRAYPDDTIIVFLVPPSVEVLRARVSGRSSVTEEEMQRRINTARSEYEVLFQEMKDKSSVDYFIVNDDRQETYNKLKAILVSERQKLMRQMPDDVRRICKLC